MFSKMYLTTPIFFFILTFYFIQFLSTLIFVGFKDFSHSGHYGVIWHCGINLYIPCDWYWTSFQVHSSQFLPSFMQCLFQSSSPLSIVFGGYLHCKGYWHIFKQVRLWVLFPIAIIIFQVCYMTCECCLSHCDWPLYILVGVLQTYIVLIWMK